MMFLSPLLMLTIIISHQNVVAQAPIKTTAGQLVKSTLTGKSSSTTSTTTPTLPTKTTPGIMIKTTLPAKLSTTTAPTKCQTNSGQSCMFPFTYNGIVYNACTTVDNGGTRWCATSLYSSGAALGYGICTAACPTPSTTPKPIPTKTTPNMIKTTVPAKSSTTTPTTTSNPICKTSNGKSCIFPFLYGGVKYTSCTTVGDTMPWCPTSLYTNGAAFDYGYCSNSCPKTSTTIPPTKCQTNSGLSCIFPFTYNDIVYNACTTVDNGGTRWCATSLYSSGAALDFGHCTAACPTPSTTPKPVPTKTTPNMIKTTVPAKSSTTTPTITSNPIFPTTTHDPTVCLTKSGRCCVFPFVYNGHTYNSCTTVHNGGIPWCATRVYYNHHYASYGECTSSCKGVSTTVTSGSGCYTTSGKECIFPFIYLGVTYNKCTSVGGHTPWCATSKLDSGNFWDYGYCNEKCRNGVTDEPKKCLTTSGVPCVFPFKYYGITYSKCTTTKNWGIPWCSTRTDSYGGESLSNEACSSTCI